MTSSVAMPMQLLLTICESLLVLDNRLRTLIHNFDVPTLTRDIVLEEILERTLAQKTPKELFSTGNKVLCIDELWQLYKALEHEALSFNAESFVKVKYLGLLPGSSLAAKEASLRSKF